MKASVNDQMERLTILSIAQGMKSLTSPLGIKPKKAETQEDLINFGHLLWMLEVVEENYETWPLGKLGRWVGIVMGCLACHGIDISDLQTIVSEAKMAYGETIDHDLAAHLDKNDPFTIDIGVGD